MNIKIAGVFTKPSRNSPALVCSSRTRTVAAGKGGDHGDRQLA
jgi:hypothetical protein